VDDMQSSAHRAIDEGAQDHPHACLDGWIYLGYVVESPHDLDGEVVEYERLPCRRCAEEAVRGR
jgi:hypothetical protein